MEAFKNTLQHRIYGGALYCCIMVFVFVLLAEGRSGEPVCGVCCW